MEISTIVFGSKSVQYHFDAVFEQIDTIIDLNNAIFITDENVFARHQQKFKSLRTIVLASGENTKNQQTVDDVIQQLIALGAGRTSILVGVGGGVVTDITGYAAAIYMRGIRTGFVPTTVLAMVDAAIGGKNGINIGVYKNAIGTIRQPDFILYDIDFLQTLPDNEWQNGFAEIIKHACIKDAGMFSMLASNNIAVFKENKQLLSALIKQNVLLKSDIVQQDEEEQGSRKLLNFGHTLGHAIENSYPISHGEAISIGMVFAASLSEQYMAFSEITRIIQMLSQYGLPVSMKFDMAKALDVMKMDKKRIKEKIHFILLKKIGEAVILPIDIEEWCKQYEYKPREGKQE